MDSGKLVTVALVAGGGYLAYKWWQGQQAAASVPAAPVSAAPATPATSSAVASTPAAPASSSLDAMYQQLLATATAAGVNATTGVSQGGQPIDPSGWNYYLSQLYTAKTLPGDIFPASAQSQPMSLSSYWAVMAPWLSSNAGLSGLGVFGGLGQIAMRMRRAY
jgi:hypothetical protein